MALRVEGISHHFGLLNVLENVSFVVDEGEFICIVGPNGCGKTTLLRIIANLLPPSEGCVYYKDEPIISERGDIGYVFQESALFPWLTAKQNVAFGLQIHRKDKGNGDQIVENYLRLVELTEFKGYYPKSLSGGMKQLLAVARALAYGPKIMLMDEPFVALDAQTRIALQERLLEIWSQEKKTILFVTHNFDEAVFLADRIVILTGRPASVGEIVTVDIRRPRKRTSVENCEVRDRLQKTLAGEANKGDKGFCCTV